MENVQYFQKVTCLLAQSADLAVSSGDLVRALNLMKASDGFINARFKVTKLTLCVHG